ADALGVALDVPEDALVAADQLLREVLLRFGTLAWPAAAALLLLASRARPWLRLAPAAVLVALDLVLAARPTTATQPAEGFLGSHPMIEHLQETVGRTGRLARYGEGGAGLLGVSLSPNLAGVYGLLHAWCYTVTPPARWMRLCERIDPDGAWHPNGVFVPPLASGAPLPSKALHLL